MSHEQPPVAWDDAADDDLIVSRESLAEGAPHAAGRAAAPQPIGWQSALSLRQRATRGGAIALLIAATLFTLLGGPAATLNAIHTAGNAPHTRLPSPTLPPTLATQGYTTIKSPPGGYNVSEMSIAPIAGQANAAWSCWVTPYSSPGRVDVWTAHAFTTTDAGVHWAAHALPATPAQNCTVIADGESPGGALIMLGHSLVSANSCPIPTLYLTTDAGATWSPVPWPSDHSDSVCAVSAALRGGAIYLWSTAPLMRGAGPYLPPTGRLIVSRDAGRAWAPADVGLDDSAGLAIVAFRPGGHILATIADVRISGGASTLMASDDFGASWRDLGDPPGAFPQVFASSDNAATDHGGWGRLYELADTQTNGAPTEPPQRYLATTYIGQSWTAIPLPPLPDGAATDAQSSLPLVVGVGPTGALEVERGIIEAPNAQLSPARRLWLWSISQHVWLLDPQAVPGNAQLQGASWRAGDQIVWLTTLQLGVPPILQIYTKAYPATVFGRSQATAATNR